MASTEITVPPIGTRVEVTSRMTLDWMNTYRRPTTGIVAHSNSWDKPGTFRVIGVENPENKNGEGVIALEYVTGIRVLGTSEDPEDPGSANIPDPQRAQVFEIKGSKDNIYTVTLDGDKSSCTCQAGSHGRLCKHVKTAREMLLDR